MIVTKSFSELLPIAEEELSRCNVELLRNEPFFGHLLGGIQRHFTNSVNTLDVGIRGNFIQLLINPNFLLKELTKSENRIAVLKHEVLHLVFKHIFRNKTLKYDPILWNIAADLVVNQYVAPYQLPEGAILLSTFPDINFSPQDTADNYYLLLEKLQNEISKNKSKQSDSAKILKSILKNKMPSDHSYWANGSIHDIDGELVGEKVPATTREALNQTIEDQILKAYKRVYQSNFAGKIPAWLERFIDQTINDSKPKVDWRKTIRIFSSSCRGNQLKSTQLRESKRYEVLDGMIPSPGIKLKRIQNLVLAIDTSGSINTELLKLFFIEIHAIFKQGAKITVLECDSEIKQIYIYNGIKPKLVKGGGGTSFEPVMLWLKQSKKKFDGCIYLTDGYADAPETKPPCRILWVIFGNDSENYPKYGKRIYI